jgi:2-succinyl-5-enolpyruvyl-6-hydroxy-3-cyclohexene-1-carboxylate synthase
VAARMPAHGGDRVAQALEAHGVRFVFTLCGGHISPILVAAKARGLHIVDTRNEASAVFAADAVARLTGTPGVAAVTAGPGLTNTITAVKNAQLAQSPLVLLGGAAPTALQGRGAFQERGDIQYLGYLAHALVDLVFRHFAPGGLQWESQVLIDAVMRVECIGLECHGNVAVLRLDRIDQLIADVNQSAIRVLHACDQFQCRGLACSRRT